MSTFGLKIRINTLSSERIFYLLIAIQSKGSFALTESESENNIVSKWTHGGFNVDIEEQQQQ